MEERHLGTSGLAVSVIGLGGNTFGETADGEEAVRTIEGAIDQGITFIDTADVYAMGRSEELVGKAIAGKRESVVVATKCGLPFGGGQHARGLSRRWIMQAAEDSLRRLGTDYIDLFYAHAPDPSTPIEETLRAMDDLVRSGKVRYIGCSNYAAWQVARAIGVSEREGLERWVVAQNHWNVLDGLDRPELAEAAGELGIGIVPFYPLASGLLTGKYTWGEEPAAGTRFGDLQRMRARMTRERMDRIGKLTLWAEERGRTATAASIAWLLAHPAVSSVIPGVRSADQVAENIKAAEWVMTPEERDELTALMAEG